MRKYRIIERTDDNLKVSFIVEGLFDLIEKPEWKALTQTPSFNAAKNYIRSLTFTEKVVYEVER